MEMKARKIDEALSRGGDPLDTMGAGKNSPDTTYKKDLKDAVNQIHGFWDDAGEEIQAQIFAQLVKWVYDIASAYEVSIEDAFVGIREKLDTDDPNTLTTDFQILYVLNSIDLPEDIDKIRKVARNFNSRWMMTLDFEREIKDLWHEIRNI